MMRFFIAILCNLDIHKFSHMYIDIRCPNCFANLPSQNLDIKKETATCPECSTEFSLKKTIEKDLRKKTQINQPDRFKVLSIGNQELDIKYSFQYKSAFATFFILLVVSNVLPIVIPLIFFLVFFAAMANLGFYIVIPIIFIALFLLFRIYKLSNNIKANINIKNQLLSIKNPEFRIKKDIKKAITEYLVEPEYQIDTELIDQIYIKETTSKKGKVMELFLLNFRLKDGTEIAPILPLLDLKEALFIEQEIEKHLGISDIKMPNEYKI